MTDLDKAFEAAADAMAPVINKRPSYDLKFLESYGGPELKQRYINGAKAAIEAFMQELDV